MNDVLLDIALAAGPAILAITLHEAAHGYAALALGDDTAKRMGRLSINPLRHVDLVGTLLLPGALILLQLVTIHRVIGTFGWAKPVPVSAWKFRDPRRGMALVAAAGPAANFVLAWMGALLLHGLDWLPLDVAQVVLSGLEMFILANLVLGLFNLLPIPPLDGGRMLVGVLPAAWAAQWARLERAGLLLVLLLVVSPYALSEMGITFSPVGAVLDAVLPWALRLVGRLAFIDV